MKLLITGIDGFTGEHLANYLKDDFEIFGTSLNKNGNNIFKCDITKKEQIQDIVEKLKPEYIIHLAAISYAAEDDRLSYYNVNVLGSENLINSINYDVKKIIIASSATVYGNQNSEILDESMCPEPNSHYGISKLALEKISKNYFEKLPIILTRPFNYTGIGQSEKFLIPKIVSHYKQKKTTISLGNLDVIREFNDVKFVCECYKRLLLSDIKSEIVNIASGRGIKLLDIIDMMNKIAGYEIEVKQDKKFIRKNDIKKLIGSNKKLFSLIGEVRQPGFVETLREMYEYSN